MGRDTFLGKVQAVKRLYLAYLFAEVEIFFNILGFENRMKTVDVSLLKNARYPNFYI